MLRGLARIAALLVVPGLTTASTELFIDSDRGDFIGGGRRVLRTPMDGTVTVSGGPDGVHVGFVEWELDFVPPAGGSIAPGVYEGAESFPFELPAHPGLDVSAGDRGCNKLAGRFVVRAAVFGPEERVLAFAVDFEQHCELDPPALFGTLLYATGDAACAGKPDGAACDDGDPCTSGDACLECACVGNTICGAGTSCSVAHCTPRDGTCIDFDRLDGIVCDDGNPTTVDGCEHGRCNGLPSVSTTTATTVALLQGGTCPTLASVTTTTTPPTSTTTTLPCTSARCTLDAALASPTCADQAVPASVTNNFNDAASLIEKAEISAARQAKKLLKRAKTALKKAKANATRAAKGNKPKISSDCAAALRSAAEEVAAGA